MNRVSCPYIIWENRPHNNRLSNDKLFKIFTNLIFTRIEGPPTDENGVTPVPNDLQVVAGIAVSI